MPNVSKQFMEVGERCLYFSMPQLLDFLVSENTNSEKERLRFQMYSVYLLQLKA